MSKIQTASISDHLYNRASMRKMPISGTFELSPVCNFDCRMCYIRKSPRQVREHHRPILKLEDWRRIAREARDCGMLFLLLTGGEPFLWPDFWTLYEELVDMGLLVAINTNGSLIDDAAVERLKRRPPRRVNITLYGANDETYQRLCGAKGVFHKVDRAIRSLQEAGIPVKINCSLTPCNCADLEQMVDYAKSLGLRLDLATYMFPPIRKDPGMIGVNERFTPEEAAYWRMKGMRLQSSEEDYRSFLERVQRGCAEPPGLEEGCYDPLDGKIRCRAGKASFWITWDGWLTACGMMPEPKTDLYQADFPTNWQHLTELAAETRLSGVCAKCDNFQLCHPCAAMATAETGSTGGIPRYLCHMAKEMRRIAASES